MNNYPAPYPISWTPSEGSNVPGWLAPPSSIGRPASAQGWTAPQQPVAPWGGGSNLYAPPRSPLILNVQPPAVPPSPNALYAPSPAHDIRRPSSTGPYQTTPYSPYQQGIPAYAKPDTFDERNLARRPRDWRDDYEPHYGVKSLLHLVGKSRTDVPEYTDSVRRTLHPLLLYSSHDNPAYLDLRLNPLQPNALSFPGLKRLHNDLDLAQLATQPPAHLLRLVHSSLPWYIDIRASHPNGITIYDILTQVYNQLMTGISSRHYYNEALSIEDRAAIGKAFQERCHGDMTLVQQGVKQIDYLEDKVIFEGLTRGWNGMWEIKTRSRNPKKHR